MQQALYLTDSTTTADFLTGNARLAFDGYSMLEDYDEEGYVWETIKLINPASYTTDDEMRAAKKTIDDLLETARRYHNTTLEPNPVWLYCQSYGEQARRACVIDGKSEIVGTEFDSPLFGVYGLELNVAIRRGPWESDTMVTSITNTSIGDNGDTWVIGNAAGSLNQRIAAISLTSTTGALIYDAWIGIRPLYNGTAGFEPLWDCANAQVDGIDTDISGGAMRVMFGGSAEMAHRGYLYYEDVCGGNYDDLAGRYLVLARCAVNAADTECALQVRLGSGVTNSIVGTVYVTSDASINNSYRLFEIGEIQLPPAGNRNQMATMDAMKQIAFDFYAERLSDAGSLYVDYVLLIPSEHAITFQSGYLGGPDYYFAYSDPDKKEYAAGMYSTTGAWNDTGTTLVTINGSFHNWSYPVGGGVLVMAAQANIHNTGHAYMIDMSMVPRWTSYRTT